MVIRFSLKTLLTSAVVIGILALGWTLVRNNWPTSVEIENGNLRFTYLAFGNRGNLLSGTAPDWYLLYYRYPLWIVGVLAIVGIAALVGAIVLLRYVRSHKSESQIIS